MTDAGDRSAVSMSAADRSQATMGGAPDRSAATMAEARRRSSVASSAAGYAKSDDGSAPAPPATFGAEEVAAAAVRMAKINSAIQNENDELDIDLLDGGAADEEAVDLDDEGEDQPEYTEQPEYSRGIGGDEDDDEPWQDGGEEVSEAAAVHTGYDPPLDATTPAPALSSTMSAAPRSASGRRSVGGSSAPVTRRSQHRPSAASITPVESTYDLRGASSASRGLVALPVAQPGDPHDPKSLWRRLKVFWMGLTACRERFARRRRRSFTASAVSCPQEWKRGAPSSSELSFPTQWKTPRHKAVQDGDVVSKLQDLARLSADGLLSESEFIAAKSAVLQDHTPQNEAALPPPMPASRRSSSVWMPNVEDAPKRSQRRAYTRTDLTFRGCAGTRVWTTRCLGSH
eukprot:TRINITY_DN1028_c3_g1_i2.p1 TRINITY_DN1028_c3_g1~~TRINITY_DN1028_c3_g1_i2.p1  ORF type:complete len:401 (+),score=110.93 TRINITY_DN1028_c3_g1_i2:47-1249(+)